MKSFLPPFGIPGTKTDTRFLSFFELHWLHQCAGFHFFSKKKILVGVHMLKNWFRLKKMLFWNPIGGGGKPIFWIEPIKIIEEKLSDTKFLYVIKGCLKNFARAKNVLRARKLKKSTFSTTNFSPPPLSTLQCHYKTKPGLQISCLSFKTSGNLIWYLQTCYK